MNKQFQIIASLLILLSLFSITNQCVYLQSGFTTITKTSNQQQYIFEFTPNFVAPNNRAIQAVASASNLQINWVNGVDFSIIAHYNQNTNRVIIVVYIPSINTWTSIQISYFLSGRSQFYLGTYYANVYIDSINANGQPFNTNVPIAQMPPSNAIFKGVVQYSGIRSSQSSVSVTTNSLSVNANTGFLTMNIRISPGARVHYLVISYIVFIENPITHTPFVFSGNIPTSDFVWIGIQSINGVSSIFEGNSFFSGSVNTGLRCIGALCGNQQCLTPQLCVNLGGVVSGNNCFRCRQGQQISNNLCVANTCNRPNYVWNGFACVCIANFVQVNNNCYPVCGNNAYLLNGNCVCLPGFNRVGQQCLASCPVNQAINPITNLCIPCNNIPGHFIQNFICRCISNYQMTLSGCQICPPNSSVDPQTQRCTCNPGFQLSGNQCVRSCIPPQILVSGVCICPPGQAINPITNLCMQCRNNAIQFIQNNTCFCRPPNFMTHLGCQNCFPNSQYDPNTRSCRCITGFQLIGNNQCAPICTGGQIRIGNICACPFGQGLSQVTNSCIPCTTLGHILSNNICRCASTHFPSPNGCVACPPNSQYNTISRRCICRSGFYQDNNNNCLPCASSCLTCSGPSNQQCTSCRAELQLINGQCLGSCPGGQIRVGNICVCPSGQGLSEITNNCIQCTAAGHILSANICRCASTHFATANGCVACPPNSLYNATLRYCVCNQGFYPDNNNNCLPCHSSCLTCSGPSESQCTRCPGNITLVNGFCRTQVVCPQGFYRSQNNTCLACLANCASCIAGNTCIRCLSGYRISTVGTVVTCVLINSPPGLRISLRSFVVGNNVIYQGVSMNQMPTAILQNGCNICNQLLLVTLVINPAVSVTTNIQYINGSQYWFLIQFRFTNAAFIPAFQFKVQINPIYARFFTPADMALSVFGSISQQNIYPPDPLTNFAESSSQFAAAAPQSIASSSAGVVTSSGSGGSKSKQEIISQIFNRRN